VIARKGSVSNQLLGYWKQWLRWISFQIYSLFQPRAAGACCVWLFCFKFYRAAAAANSVQDLSHFYLSPCCSNGLLNGNGRYSGELLLLCPLKQAKLATSQSIFCGRILSVRLVCSPSSSNVRLYSSEDMWANIFIV
jgi:hypothetical protein